MSERQQVFSLGEAGGGPERGFPSRILLGARGAALAEMSAARLPVPPGFAVSAEVCAYYLRHHRRFPPAFWDEIREHFRRLTAADGARFGLPSCPLLLCVQPDVPEPRDRELSAIRYVGLSDRLLQGFVKRTGSRRAAWDAYRRLLVQFGTVAAGVPAEAFEAERRRLLNKYGVASEFELDDTCLRELCDLYKRTYFEKSGHPFPQDPMEQLRAALVAAYARWGRRDADPTRSPGVAMGIGAAMIVTVAVFGHLDENSAVVRAASRNGTTGAHVPSGEYLVRAQEEDLDVGERRPLPLDRLGHESSYALRQASEEILARLQTLENKWGYPQRAVFVVERGRVWITESAPAPRNGRAAVRWALEMRGGRTDRGVAGISPAEAPRGLDEGDVEEFLRGSPIAVANGEPAPRSLLDAFRTGVREARRHPDYRLWRQLNHWTVRQARLHVWAEASDPGEIRLARRLQADGALILSVPGGGPPDAARDGDRRVIESLCSAARDLPLLFDLADRAGALVQALTGYWNSRKSRPTVGPVPAILFDAEVVAEKGTPDLSSAGAGSPSPERGGRIATPRAALTADATVEGVALLVFDLPALTRACLGGAADQKTSRALDIPGVGQLVEIAVRKARATRHDIRLYALGMSASDVAGLRFLDRLGFDGVMAPAAGVLAMRLAAAQAARR